MECLNPIKATSNQKYFLLSRLQSYENEYPCCECAACRGERQIQEYVRAQYQAKETLEVNHGYVIFDTLTYNDWNLPHIQDVLHDLDIHIPGRFLAAEYNISCFRPLDIRLFIVRLRRYLSYHYGVSENCFDYLICSEYGTDPNGTQRPHYHIVFYVNVPDTVIDPVDFSNAIDFCWGKGRTDGVPYQGVVYFKSRRLFTVADKNSLTVSVLNVINYVTKYIGKQQEFEDKFTQAADGILQQIYPKCPDLSLEELWKVKSISLVDYQLLRKFIKSCRPFSKKSHGYGEYFVEWLQSDDPDAKQQFKTICESATVTVRMNKKSTVYRAPLPQYYYRKLFMENYIDIDGKKQWRLSTFGNMFRKKQIESSIDHAVDQMEEFYQNRSSLSPLLSYQYPLVGVVYDTVEDAFAADVKTMEDIYRRYNRKSFFKFCAQWSRLYQGRIIDTSVVPDVRSSNKFRKLGLPTPDEMIDLQLRTSMLYHDPGFQESVLKGHKQYEQLMFEGRPVLYNYSGEVSKRRNGSHLLSDCWLGDDRNGYANAKDLQSKNDEALLSSFGHEQPVLNVYDTYTFGMHNVISFDKVWYGSLKPLLLYEDQRFYEDVKVFICLYRKYRGIVKANCQDKYDFLHEVEDRLEKVYNISKKYRK